MRLAAILLACVALGAQALHAEPTSRALLIGINDYVAVPDLRGALNDIELLRQVLVSRYGFPAENVEVLRDADATRAAILGALDRLAKQTQPGDLVYIHYSGHGSQVTDLNGDETDDQRDETIIPHDGRTPGVADITDDELAEELARFPDAQVVIVLDSCHSGTATRGLGAVRPRFVPPDERIDLYRRPQTRGIVPLTHGGHVLLTGAANTQEALDGPVDGRPHGLFSYALAQSMSRAPADASPRVLFRGVEQELERIKGQLGLTSMPEPQLEAEAGQLDAALLVPGAAKPVAEEPARLPWVTAEPAGAGRVRLVGGVRLGAVPGSLWALYPPGERDFPPGRALAQAAVTSVEGEDALARLAPPSAALPSDSRATPLAPAPPSERVPVRIQWSDAAREARLRAALAAQLGSIAFVDPGHFARYVLAVEGQRCRVLGADGRYEVASLDFSSEEGLAAAVASALARSMTVAELLALENPLSEIQLDLSVAARGRPADRAGEQRSVVVVGNTQAARFRIRQEDDPRTPENSLQLRVRASSACYLSLVDVDSEGGVHLLFPNEFSESKGYLPNGKLGAGEPVLIPDSLEEGNLAGFFVDYAPPAGTDTVRAFCSPDPDTTRLLRQTIAKLRTPTQATRGIGSRAPVREALSVELRDQLASLASRGVRLVADTPKPPGAAPNPPAPAAAAAPVDWAAASVTIEVEE